MGKQKIEDLVFYQIHSSRWACYIWWNWGQELASKYYVWKCKGRFKTYLNRLEPQKTVTQYLKRRGL